ncbi:MAG: hypothetical protein IT314_16815 [Anaerolineales bacterium]|nr:hypothetical protein [Anaerolineales bacterium]
MNKHTLRFDTLQHGRSHPSLFPLRMILFSAELETPTQPPYTPRDADETLALALIERIKRPQSISFSNLQVEAPQALRSDSILDLVSADA